MAVKFWTKISDFFFLEAGGQYCTDNERVILLYYFLFYLTSFCFFFLFLDSDLFNLLFIVSKSKRGKREAFASGFITPCIICILSLFLFHYLHITVRAILFVTLIQLLQ